MRTAVVVSLVAVLLAAGCRESRITGVDADAAVSTDGSTPVIDGGDTVADRMRAAHAAADGALDIDLDSVVVTYLKPEVGTEPAGFFIQAELDGPALFVEIDPTTLSPAAKVGDQISLKLTEIGSVSGDLRRIISIENYQVVASGGTVDDLVQLVTNATDLVTGLNDYESELIELSATIVSDFGYAGTGHQSATIQTAGISDSDAIKVRLPETLVNSLSLSIGCSFRLTGVMWRFTSTAQPAAWSESDVTDINCGPPKVVQAIAASETSVIVTFDRAIDPDSVTDGSEFSIEPALVVSAAEVNGTKVTLSTGTQNSATTYTVTVAASVEDLAGTGVDAGANTATFNGFKQRAVVVINEYNANVDEGNGALCDLLELRVVAPGSIEGFELWEKTDSLTTFGALTVNTNDYIVIHFDSDDGCNPNGAPNEFLFVNEQPASAHPRNFDNAYDFYIIDGGLTRTTNTFAIYDPLGGLVDAVVVTNGTSNPSAAAETQAALIADDGGWTTDQGTVPSGGFVDDAFHSHAVPGLDQTDLTQAGTSIQRTGDVDNNHKGDWGAPAASSWGGNNAGQSDL